MSLYRLFGIVRRGHRRERPGHGHQCDGPEATTTSDHQRWRVRARTLIACVLLGMAACGGDDDDGADRETQLFRECIITSAGQRFCSIVGQCGRRENDRCADPVFMCTTVQTTPDRTALTPDAFSWIPARRISLRSASTRLNSTLTTDHASAPQRVCSITRRTRLIRSQGCQRRASFTALI
jgi:hypothetical protein